ncbi:MAG: type III PLP-dependent enzyme [Xanthomonadaceae bacterium]|nr:type III PLP-dependent enzyme [Xanthomonadaceae bacterium]
MNKSQLRRHFSDAEWARIRALADTQQTPFLVVHLDTVRAKYQELREGFPTARIYYAVKANPAPEVLKLLAGLGCCFDIASRYELDLVMGLGVTPDRISYGNTIKKAVDVRYAYEKGVRVFASDSEMDVRRIAREAPGAHLHIRVLTEGTETADWPLSRKFGCQQEMVVDMILLARDLGLDPAGISFHVGSQQRDLGAWDAALAKVKFIFDKLESHGVKLRQINMGGGFPAHYVNRTHEIPHYCEEITRFLQEDFGDEMPEIMLEPGRSLVGESGVIVSEVVLISRKSRYGLHRWVYTDIGVFGGLIETLGESIKYPIFTERQGKPEEAVLSGPTCDSMDIMYEDNKVPLPLSLEEGDRLYWLSTGAYTTSYSSIAFNGFPPLKAYFV